MIDVVDPDVVSAVARRVVGADTTVLGTRLLGPSTGNLSYAVTLSGQERTYVFRFNRGFREDVYETEAANYRRVHEATGVRVPEIVAIDRTRTLAPTSYMVLEYLDGVEWTTLRLPEVRRAAGAFYAKLHAVTRPAVGDESIAHLLLGLEQFAKAGYLELDLDRVARCAQAVREDSGIREADLSLCMSDGEIYFDDHHQLAFVCDLEWVGFSNRLADLTGQVLAGDERFDEVVAPTPGELARDPFFQEYGRTHSVDYEALSRIALYSQLSTWGLVAAEGAPIEKKQWIRECKLPLIEELIDRIRG